VSPSASGSVGGWSSGVDVRSHGAIDGREDPRLASLGSVKDLGRPVSQGSEEHPTIKRLDGRTVIGAAGWLWPVGV
jgi:hypothetical protein